MLIILSQSKTRNKPFREIKAVRNGFERHVENAVRLIRRLLPCSPELLFIYALPVILALAVLSVLLEDKAHRCEGNIRTCIPNG